MEKRECPDGGQESYGGVMWELVKLMKQTRNVTISFVTGDGAWGLCHNSSSCTGMVGMVNRREVDFALGILICWKLSKIVQKHKKSNSF